MTKAGAAQEARTLRQGSKLEAAGAGPRPGQVGPHVTPRAPPHQATSTGPKLGIRPRWVVLRPNRCPPRPPAPPPGSGTLFRCWRPGPPTSPRGLRARLPTPGPACKPPLSPRHRCARRLGGCLVGEGGLAQRLFPGLALTSTSPPLTRLQVTPEMQLKNTAFERHHVCESGSHTQAADEFLSVLSFLEPRSESTALT